METSTIKFRIGYLSVANWKKCESEPTVLNMALDIEDGEEIIMGEGTGTVEKHAFAMSEMLLIIKSLDSIKEQGNTFCASTSSAQEKQVDESNMGAPSGDVLSETPIPKQNKTRQHKGHHKGVLEKDKEKEKYYLDQVESPTGTSNALPDEDQILEATNGSVQSTLDSWVPQAYNGPSGYYPLNTCMYPDLSMAQSFPFHQHGPPSMPMMSFNHSLLYSQVRAEMRRRQATRNKRSSFSRFDYDPFSYSLNLDNGNSGFFC
ncbi:hypothetical protein IFM89_018918 [Coptis chinensis]|uniref:Uncharacterized protein n=1 Tax=Coptis chinensis TaxID=261450 RepID=A0A835LM19_9MAGN|nr:hypothetical protein IFM89_018918 [Coptis chinensis]